MKKRTGLGICLLLCAALLLTGCRDAGLPSVSAPFVSHASAVSAPNTMSEIPSDLSENESVPPDVPEPLFTFDPHLLSEDAKRYLGDDLIPLYTRAVDSILAHDGVVEDVASEADFYRVWHVILFENYALRAMIHNANNALDLYGWPRANVFPYECGRLRGALSRFCRNHQSSACAASGGR